MANGGVGKEFDNSRIKLLKGRVAGDDLGLETPGPAAKVSVPAWSWTYFTWATTACPTVAFPWPESCWPSQLEAHSDGFNSGGSLGHRGPIWHVTRRLRISTASDTSTQTGNYILNKSLPSQALDMKPLRDCRDTGR
jgi:hypothetical protein